MSSTKMCVLLLPGIADTDAARWLTALTLKENCMLRGSNTASFVHSRTGADSSEIDLGGDEDNLSLAFGTVLQASDNLQVLHIGWPLGTGRAEVCGKFLSRASSLTETRICNVESSFHPAALVRI
eukprot:966500-Rhodomonas_salina.1